MRTTSSTYHLVIGLGTSGMSMANFLHSKGISVIATDMDASKADAAKTLDALGIETQVGFHDPKTFNNAAVLVPSPGIPLTNTFIKTAMDCGVPITSELDIFFEHNEQPVIAITGTNGKTTTTTLIGDMLKACNITAFIGGNIGTPLVDHLMSEEKADVIVAEISSFQLDISQHFTPDIGVLLNISQDHMDRYNTFADYEKSKWSLFKRQSQSNTAVINSSIKEYDTFCAKLSSKILSFCSKKSTDTTYNATIGSNTIDINLNDACHKIKTKPLVQLVGRHNHENIAAAILSCLAIGADINGIKKGLDQFENLPHRVQWVKNINGISFYNDSKGTNTDAVIRAIQCFKNKIVLILGGREKGTDFSQLSLAIKQNVKSIIAIGESKSKIVTIFKNSCQVLEAQTMKEAVHLAFNLAKENETVLLSPACASFDMYENYAHRGNDFINHVNELKGI